MLSEETRTIIKATVPALEQHGTEITSTFYQNMLNDHKELLNIFNRANQTKGLQSTALATTVLAAAKNIDNLAALLPHVRQIGHKHRALQVKPEHYPIVGEYLLKAIKQVLGDAANQTILDAWAEAYGVIAQIFIDVEAELYAKEAWDGWKSFRVVKREDVGGSVLEFTVQPIDEASTPAIVPGQYITVKAHPTAQDNQYDALRHYSICSSSGKEGLKFAVKKAHSDDHDGLVSTYLHENVKVGDTVELSAPAGDFNLNESLIEQNDIPLVFLSSGVGSTPLLAMLEKQIATNKSRPIVWIETAYNAANQPFAAQIKKLSDGVQDMKVFTVHTESTSRIDDAYLAKVMPSNSDVYVSGSIGFVEDMIDSLNKLNHREELIHYEPFGQKMATVKV
ncbi:LAMI_0G02212g1_1 [Lachancea mirantina]|uniref:nitric oxide dioxygenase n=1 Tax=Lachancea mirantina TaxID=1230905 RepID=A0A1G4K7P6_9SACH|nr:LAMI_0G02212g1_1 [Lachancea mirantina]